MTSPLTPREQFIMALERRPPVGHVPHAELAFYLTQDAFGKAHPGQRDWAGWEALDEREREARRDEIADLYIAIAERFEHSAIVLDPRPDTVDDTARLAALIREKSGDRYGLLGHGDATYGIPPGAELAAFCYRLVDDPRRVKQEAQRRVDATLSRAETLMLRGGLDGFVLGEEYAFSTGPFLSPGQFAEFITPYLARLIDGYRMMGFYTIKHSGGNVMPILDQLIQARPDALHTLDASSGVDLGEVKRRYGSQVCLMGNVSSAVLRHGTESDIRQAVRAALARGMPGGGFILATSGTITPDIPLAAYDIMLDEWRVAGRYADAG